MDAVTRSELTAIAKEIRALQMTASKLADRLDQVAEAMIRSTGVAPYKRADGRLTDAGIAAADTAFERGATVTEVANLLGIHVSGASNRRKIWLASKAEAAGYDHGGPNHSGHSS